MKWHIDEEMDNRVSRALNKRPEGYVPRKLTRKHGWFCRLFMALASRRVCTCGKSRTKARSPGYVERRWLRRR